MPLPAVVVYSRTDCHLCEHALDALRRIAGEVAFELAVRDVDAEPTLAERYGVTVPVVTVDDLEVSAGRFDGAAVRRAIRGSAATAVDSGGACS
jgi:glutaredoxin